MGLDGAPMFIYGAAAFNKPGGLLRQSTISLETTNGSLATLSAPVCLTLVDASKTTLECERALSNLPRPTMTLFMTGQSYHHRNCALGLAFLSLFQSLCKVCNRQLL
jgi:hypothetical protein